VLNANYIFVDLMDESENAIGIRVRILVVTIQLNIENLEEGADSEDEESKSKDKLESSIEEDIEESESQVHLPGAHRKSILFGGTHLKVFHHFIIFRVF